MPSPRIPQSLRDEVRQRAENCCEYCRTPEWLIGMEHEIDHIVPRAAGGESVSDNLCLACSSCNGCKHAKRHGVDQETGQMAPLFHPRKQHWNDHFEWDNEGTNILGLTPVGRATVAALQINHPLTVIARSIWASFGYHPSDFPSK